MIASTTKSAPDKRLEIDGGRQPPERRVTIGGRQLALLDEFAERLVDAAARAVQRGCDTSCSVTVKPDCAKTCAMPEPMVPEPITAM